MTVLDVYLNDRKLCRAGVGKDGVLDAIVSWVKLTAPAKQTARRLEKPVEEARLHVGGLRADVHRAWSDRPLKFGDRVAIVLNRAREFDSPVRQRQTDPKQVERQQQRYYLRLKQQFEKPQARLSAGKEGARYGAHFELSMQSDNADQLLRRFVKRIDGLPPSARRLWNQARTREFNVGIQAASKPYSFELGLAPATLLAVARVNARIGITVYGTTGSVD